jgi:hypothetical protein
MAAGGTPPVLVEVPMGDRRSRRPGGHRHKSLLRWRELSVPFEQREALGGIVTIRSARGKDRPVR